jgi:hypothetical protein
VDSTPTSGLNRTGSGNGESVAHLDLAAQDVIDALDSFFCHSVVSIWADPVAYRLEA